MNFFSTKITNVNIPSKLKLLMPGAFAHCVLTDINVASDNPYYKKINGILLFTAFLFIKNTSLKFPYQLQSPIF